VKVGRSWKCLYRAVDNEGQTIEFLLTANRDISAVKRFFRKMIEGVEAMHMLHKGQVKRFSGSDAVGQAEFVA
jgi:transposase-like protein